MDSTPSTDRRKVAGLAGETAAREHAQKLGWHIVDYNVRWREGELDLIAVDGRTLVIAEVKTLVGRGADGSTRFSPFESIGRRKQQQIRTLTRRWLTDELRRVRDGSGLRFDDLRFDAFAVTLSPAGEVTSIEHLEDAF